MAELPDVMVGDEVLIRARVLEVGPADTGYTVELFSKTDQYQARVRPDLVDSRVVMRELPPEPPDGTWLRGVDSAIGWEIVFRRDDAHAPPQAEYRHRPRWLVLGFAAGWVDWPEAVRRGADPDRRLVPTPETAAGRG